MEKAQINERDKALEVIYKALLNKFGTNENMRVSFEEPASMIIVHFYTGMVGDHVLRIIAKEIEQVDQPIYFWVETHGKDELRVFIEPIYSTDNDISLEDDNILVERTDDIAEQQFLNCMCKRDEAEEK